MSIIQSIILIILHTSNICFSIKYKLVVSHKIQINSFTREPVLYSDVLNWTDILERFIFNNRTKLILKFIDINAFYKKYLKYKEKYLQLKNQ